MTASEAIAKARQLFKAPFSTSDPGRVNYNWDTAVEFKDNPHRDAGEMWMVMCSDSDRVFAFVDEWGGDLLGVMWRKVEKDKPEEKAERRPKAKVERKTGVIDWGM